MLDFNKLLSAIDATKTTRTVKEDDSHEYWKPTTDKAGNGTAVIRFLPDSDINEIPFARIISFGFQNPENGRWYIENSLQTLGESDPANDLKGKWWNSKDLDESEFAKKVIKRRTNFFSNILVIKDPANPTNEGRVFKFRYGQKIFDKLVAAAKPEFDDQDAIMAWDPINGADFRLKIKQVAGYTNYDDSSFGPRKALFDGNKDKIDEVLSQCFSIKSLMDPSNFKSRAELEKKLAWVLGTEEKESFGLNRSTTSRAEADVDDIVRAVKEEKVVQKEQPKSYTPSSEDDDEAMFRSLLDD